MNIVVVEGRLSRPAELRVLPSGDELVAMELTVTASPPAKGSEGAEGAEGRETHESVPVSWPAPAPWGADLAAGAEVVVLGRIRRRFFRAGGTTQSRTEVVAERVVMAGWRRRVQSVLAEATARLDR